MSERDPMQGEKPDTAKAPQQSPPGSEQQMRSKPDHGEESYQGCGKLQGLSALVTGGDSGIGRAVAIAFAREGADVAIGYLGDEEQQDAQETKRWVEQAGRRCLVQQFDVREKRACEQFVQQAVREFGRLDVLVNNAAYQMSQESVLEITEEQLDRTFRTNLFGYLYMIQAALPHLKEGAVILNTGSVTGLEGNPGLVDYAATKGAIHNLAKSLAQPLSEQGIRINVVAPGPVWTPLIPATMPKEKVEKFGQDTYWQRPAQPAELAPAYVFLASADARYISGEVLAITGKSSTR